MWDEDRATAAHAAIDTLICTFKRYSVHTLCPGTGPEVPRWPEALWDEDRATAAHAAIDTLICTSKRYAVHTLCPGTGAEAPRWPEALWDEDRATAAHAAAEAAALHAPGKKPQPRGSYMPSWAHVGAACLRGL